MNERKSLPESILITSIPRARLYNNKYNLKLCTTVTMNAPNH